MKINYIRFSCIFLYLLLYISCAKMVMRSDLRFYDKARIKYITDSEKTVAFIPMMHLNKPEFYGSVKNKVDSLRNAGYTIFYESISINHQVDSLVQDTLSRKLRKVIGMHLSSYSDTDNAGMKKYQLKGLVAQSLTNTGVIVDKDIRADLPIDSLIHIYEQHRGKIILDACDFTTGLNNKYKCNKAGNSEAVFLVLTIRDQLVAKRILFETNNKIAVVYGALHFDGILRELKQRNSQWQHKMYH